MVSRVGRRAKSVVLYLDDGRVLTVALRMTGALLVAAPGTPPDPHARVVFDLADGRQLGSAMRGSSDGSACIPVVAADGWPTFSPGTGRSRWPCPSRPLAWRAGSGDGARLKTLLLDQSFIAGVGNIYADEALWRARLHPLRTADTLTAEIRRLHRGIRAALREGLAGGGASYRDYVDPDGEPGLAAERMRVYRRTGSRASAVVGPSSGSWSWPVRHTSVPLCAGAARRRR